MEQSRINHWLTVGTNVAVLFGIILLVYELQQNREMMRAQTRNEISAKLTEIQMTVASNPQLADMLTRARTGEDLTASERTQFDNRNAAMFRYWENVHYQYRLGLYDEEEFSKQREGWKSYVNSSRAIVMVWCYMRSAMSSDFVAEVDALLVKYKCE
jgi:hypothetical protein